MSRASPRPRRRSKPASNASPKWQRRDTRARLEQFARHPGCEANVASAVLGVSMYEVAELERKGSATFGQSPFALAQGVTFEKALFASGAKRLRDELLRAGVLDTDAATFVDLRLGMNGGKARTLDVAANATRDLLLSLTTQQGRARLPLIVAGAALKLPGQPALLPDAMLALDALIIRATADGPELVVGEVKTYADRAGFTDRGELAGARAQAGAYLHALGVTLRELGLQDGIRVAPDGFLVLARPGSAFPVVRAGEELRFQALRAERGFAQLRTAADALATRYGNLTEPEASRTVLSACTSYRASCVAFCERAQHCHEQAFLSGAPATLGDQASHFLGEISLERAAELLGGAAPASSAEEGMVARAREFDGVSP